MLNNMFQKYIQFIGLLLQHVQESNADKIEKLWTITFLQSHLTVTY